MSLAGLEVPIPRERPGLTREWALVLVLATTTAIIFVLCLLLAAPLLPVLTWAVALAIVARPLHRAIAARVPWPGVAAGVAVAAVALVILLPVLFVLGFLVEEAADAVAWLGNPGQFAQWQGYLESTPFVGPAFLWLRDNVDLRDVLQNLATSLGGTVQQVVEGSMLTVVQFALVLFTLFFLFRDHGQALRGLRHLMPLNERETDKVFRRVADTVHGSIYGNVVTSLIEGALGGLIFWLLGLPAPVLWGAAMAFLSLIPSLGSSVVWGPAALVLALNGEWGRALILTAWGMLAIGLIDNLLFPYLVGQRMRLHTLLLFYAILGGLMLLGATGLILGPVLVVLFLTLVEVWRQRTADGKPAEAAFQADYPADLATTRGAEKGREGSVLSKQESNGAHK